MLKMRGRRCLGCECANVSTFNRRLMANTTFQNYKLNIWLP
jgi:hypothetical protein